MKNFKKKILKNGMTILFEKRNLPIVSVIFAVKSGGNNESLKEKGISHLIEHLLYKGTTSRSAKQIADSIEKSGGEINGFTTEELVGYWCKIPSNKLNLALDVLSDMIKNPLFDEKELEKEKKVIFEEIKMYKDNPRLYVFDEIQKCLYSGTMKLSLAGTFETVSSIKRENIVEKFSNVYCSDNFILCVVGDAKFDKIVKFAEENFKKRKSKSDFINLNLKNEIKTEKRKGIDQANLIFAYHSPLANENLVFASQILITLMASGLSSRLFSEIREKRNLAYTIKGDLNANKFFSYSYVYIGTMKENVEMVKDLILKEYKKVSEDLTEQELSKAKEQLLGHYNLSMEDSQIQMMNLVASELYNNAEEFYKFEEKIMNVKLEDVKKLASEVKKGNYSFYALVPED